MIKRECPNCSGKGRIEKEKKIEIRIPEGVSNGTKLRISGEGEAGEKGSDAGDLYVVIFIKEHEYFEREGDDIYFKMPLTFAQAALGSQVEVPTLKGKAKLKIPAGTQSGTLFRMKGNGIPNLHSGEKGDQYVKVRIIVPKKLNKKQKELLKEFSEIENKGLIWLVLLTVGEILVALYLLPISFYVAGTVATLWWFFVLEWYLSHLRHYIRYFLGFLGVIILLFISAIF